MRIENELKKGNHLLGGQKNAPRRTLGSKDVQWQSEPRPQLKAGELVSRSAIFAGVVIFLEGILADAVLRIAYAGAGAGNPPGGSSGLSSLRGSVAGVAIGDGGSGGGLGAITGILRMYPKSMMSFT